VFREKITGTTADRPQLRKLMAALAHGDVVIIPAVDRLSRDTTDLLITCPTQSEVVSRNGSASERMPAPAFCISRAIPFAQATCRRGFWNLARGLCRGLVSLAVTHGYSVAACHGVSREIVCGLTL
jgi:hypothetical protein